MESSGLCCFVGDGGASLCVRGFGDSVQVQTLIANLLEEMCGENGFGHAPGGNEAAKLAVTERPGCIVSRPVVRKEPREHLKSWQACDPDASGPLRWLDVRVAGAVFEGGLSWRCRSAVGSGGGGGGGKEGLVPVGGVWDGGDVEGGGV